MTDAGRPSADASMRELQEDIERTRAELGETVEALSDKLDVKGQLKGTTDRARAEAVSLWPQVAVVAVTAIAIAIVWRRF